MGELEREKSVIIIQKWVRGWLVRRQHIEFFKKIKIRKYVINEIIGFEKTYISKISHLLDNLKTPLLHQTSIAHDRVNSIFSNIDEIRQLHIAIHNKLIEAKPLIITEIYLEMLPKFTIYYPYVKNYNNAYKIYSNLLEEDEEFAQLVDQFGYLPSLLILPVQQTPRYLLLFSELSKNTNIQNRDYPNIQKLIESIRETAKNINDCITSNENDEDDNSTFSNSSSNSSNNSNRNNNNGIHSNGNNIKRPASASSKRKPRNSIAMHKKAIDAVLLDSTTSSSPNQDYSHLPSYLRPTLASSAWSRSKVEYSPTPKFRFSQPENQQPYVYDNPLPTGINPTSELFSTPSPSTIQTTPRKQSLLQQQHNSNSSSSLPPWKPPSKSTASIADNCTKLTKKSVFSGRPASPPPPKPNFYSPPPQQHPHNSSPISSINSSSSSVSSISSGISSNGSNNNGSNGSNTPLKAANIQLQIITNNEISLTSSPTSSSKPPLSPSRHSSSPPSEKAVMERLSISSNASSSSSTSSMASSTVTSTTTSISKSHDKVKKSLSSNNLFSQTSTSISSSGSSRTMSPTNIPSSASNNSSRTASPTNVSITSSQFHTTTTTSISSSTTTTKITNNDKEKSIPLSVVVSQ